MKGRTMSASEPPPLPPLEEMDEEFKAWQRICDALEELTSVPINDDKWHPAIDAIKYWGETLHKLRLAAPQHDAKAYDEAKKNATLGRGHSG